MGMEGTYGYRKGKGYGKGHGYGGDMCLEGTRVCLDKGMKWKWVVKGQEYGRVICMEGTWLWNGYRYGGPRVC